MRRLARRLFTFCSAASLLVCILLVVFTTRSLLFGISDSVVRNADGVYAYVNSVDGKILLSRAPYPMHRSPASPVWRFSSEHATNYRPSDPPWFDVAGLAFCHAPARPRTYLMIPAWLTIPAAGAMPALWLVRLTRRRRRYADGCCPACGYDLRATPGRCPECGTAAAAKDASPA